MIDTDLQEVIQLHKEWLLSEGESGRQAVLENADLRQAELSGIDLCYAVLTGSNLERANLSGSKLVSADLRKCSLAYANLRHSDLSNANLSRARAEGADFTEARLTGSHLEQMQLDNACLRKADLTGAQARRARFTRADLSRAVLDRCCAEDAQFKQANLTNSSFLQATMRGANLPGAIVVGTNFDNSRLYVLDAITADSGLIPLNEDATMTEKDKMHARRIKNARGLQRALKIIGYSSIGSALVALVVAAITGLIDVSLMLSRQTLSSQTGFAYPQWILLSAGTTALGVLLLMARLRLDVITLSPIDKVTDEEGIAEGDLSEQASVVLVSSETKATEPS